VSSIPTNGPRRLAPIAFAALALLAVIAAFLIGRGSAAPGPASGSTVVSSQHGDEEGRGDEGHAEAGVVRFDETALKLAKLRVEPVEYRSLKTHLPVTGTVEPNLGGVVKVTARVPGKITSFAASVGDNVRAAQPLATLASTEVAEAQAAYRQARARVAVAAGNLRRQRQLAGLGEFGRHKVEEARQREIEAHGEINAAANDLAAAKNEVAEARSEKAALEGDVARSEHEAASAESEIREAESQVRALQAALAQAQTQVRVAQSKFSRYDTLLKEQLVSKQDWEQAQADHQRAISDVEAARANIAQGQAKVATAQAHRSAALAQLRAAGSRVQQAADKIETALSRQAQQESRLATARKRDAVAEEGLAREERVYRGGFLTTKEIVEAEAAWRQAQAEQQAAADRVRLMGASPGGETLLAVSAPIAGRVTERLATLGETVDPSKPLFTVVNLDSVWVQLAVHQRDLPNVRIGQVVAITPDSAPGRTFAGTVSYIGDVVDETTRTVKVRAAIQNANGVLKPQTFVRAKIAADVRSRAIAVPREAVQSFEGKTVVFVQGDHPGEFEAKEVQPGDTIGGLTVITSGLEPGAQVVTQGAFTVKAQAMKAELGHEH
jgi:cobalt-zinc-cadmium efflux system membrane fusion protein